MHEIYMRLLTPMSLHSAQCSIFAQTFSTHARLRRQWGFGSAMRAPQTLPAAFYRFFPTLACHPKV